MVAFRWDIPERFNIGADVADRYPSARALIEIDPSGAAREFTFDAISALSNRQASSRATASPLCFRSGTRRPSPTSPPGRPA